MIGSLIAFDEFGGSGGPDATLLLQLSFQEVQPPERTRYPGADLHLRPNDHGFTVAHLQSAGVMATSPFANKQLVIAPSSTAAIIPPCKHPNPSRAQ